MDGTHVKSSQGPLHEHKFSFVRRKRKQRLQNETFIFSQLEKFPFEPLGDVNYQKLINIYVNPWKLFSSSS